MTAIETLRPGFSITRLAHWIVLSWGWRRALVAFARGRGVGAGDGAVRCLAGAVLHVSDSGLAGRWRGGRPPRRPAERGDRRLVVRLRLFPRRALLGRLRLPGRCQDLRLAAAVRGRSRCRRAWPATRPSALALARLLWTRGPTRLIALAVALTAAEWLRGHLFTGFPWNVYRLRAHRAAGAGAERGADRHLGPDLHRGRGVREPGGAGRRSRRHAAALAAARARAWSCSRRSRATARCGSRARRPPLSTACGCASCSPICSRTRSSTTAPSRR